MCQSLTNAGHELVLYDVRPDALSEAAAAYGARGAASPADVAVQVDAVLISVPGPAEDEKVLLGSNGVLAGARPGLLVLDATTIGVQQSRGFAERAEQVKVEYLDSPVSVIRGVDGGMSMTFMVGGSPGVFEKARPILECMAPNVRLVGPSGSGTAAKLLNQVIYVAYMRVFAEAVWLGENAGLSLDPLLDVLGTSSAGVPNIVERFDQIRGVTKRRTTIESSLHFLELARDSFGDDAKQVPVCEAAADALRDATKAGLGGEDLVGGRKRYLHRG